MNLKDLNLFCESINEGWNWDQAIDKLANILKDKGESIKNLNWLEQDTTYVDFVYNDLEKHIKDFNNRFQHYQRKVK